ncbi:hypothetical protein G5B47_07930 [Paenibacillus sp. 7124]|uniref:CBS domain-containing protein n=1 Tax=Paenibacillus apii TaxID=1850370 RepID=A0A6M1PK80_9BACL|nr:hypothetical protein [Paenibacillus apii]NGM82343.1 hypothetical protein [Paenibacillus apii]NJJ39479.1 hypothetical protein [Paenibacillus apii]
MMTTKTASTASKLAEIIRPVPVVLDRRTCRQALRTMFEHPESKCLVLCNAAGEPVGLLMSEKFLLAATGRGETDSFYKEPVMKLAHVHPLIVDISSAPRKVLAMALGRNPMDWNDAIIVTDGGKLAGVVYVSDLHALRP